MVKTSIDINYKLLDNVKILVVDDNTDLRLSVSEYFKSRGFTVFSASDGRKALAIIEDNNIDILLLDVEMPVMNGLETLKMLEQKSIQLNVIMITGMENPKKYNFYKKGCLLFERKPVNLIELEYKIRNIYRALHNSKSGPPKNSFIDIEMNHIYEFLMQNLHNYNLNPEMVADHFNIDLSKLHYKINNLLTISLHETIKNLRLLQARELIKISSLKTAREISFKLGYRDAGYFSKLYQIAFDEDLIAELKKVSKQLSI